MNRVALIGTAPPALHVALADAGFQLAQGAEISVLWFDEESVRDLQRLARQDLLAIAFVPHNDQTEAALEAGAIDAIVGLPEPRALRERLLSLARTNKVWQRRLKAHERRARRAMAELNSTQDLLGRLIDATPNPVMASDTHGRVLVFNQSAEASLGYDSTWAREHMHVTDIYADPADARRILAEIRNSPNGLVHEVDVRLRARSGEHIPVRLSAAEVYAADGLPMATVGVFQDQRMEIALRNRLEETTEQLIETEKRAAAVEVAGAAAHELNQPLTAVMGSLELLGLRDDLPPEVHQRLERAYGQLERMASIVKALARTSRPRSTSYVGRTRIMDLSQDPD